MAGLTRFGGGAGVVISHRGPEGAGEHLGVGKVVVGGLSAQGKAASRKQKAENEGKRVSSIECRQRWLSRGRRTSQTDRTRQTENSIKKQSSHKTSLELR